MEIYDVVKKLVGSIEPVGASHIDKKTFENLKVMIQLMADIHTDLDKILYENKDMHEQSIKDSVECINRFFDRLGLPQE